MEASETSDVFATGADITPEDDPFAGSDFGDWKSPEDELGTDTTDLSEVPVVNAEGEQIGTAPLAEATVAVPPVADAAEEVQAEAAAPEPTPALPDLTPEQAAAEAAEYREKHDEPVPPTQEASVSAGETGAESAGPTEADQHIEAIAEAEAEQTGAEVAAVIEELKSDGRAAAEEELADAMGSAMAELTGESESGFQESMEAPEQAAPEAAVESVDAGDDEEAAPPEEPTVKGRTTHRRYVILQQTGAQEPTFKQVSWQVDKDNKMVHKKGPGTKRQTICLARSPEHALAIGYAAVGSPQNGVRLVAVAVLHFQPKTVAPKEEPEPPVAKLSFT